MFSYPIFASMLGQDHWIIRRNNQDAVRGGQVVIDGVTYTYGLLTDGMGNSENSEAAARLGIAKAENHLLKYLADPIQRPKLDTELSHFPDSMYNVMLNWIKKSALLFQPDDMEKFLIEFFMFTLHGYIIGPETTTVFGSGDGSKIINNQIQILKPKSGFPEYIGVKALPTTSRFFNPTMLDGLDHDSYYSNSIENIGLATDGLEGCLNKLVPELELIGNSIKLHERLYALMQLGYIRDDGSIVYAKREHDSHSVEKG